MLKGAAFHEFPRQWRRLANILSFVEKLISLCNIFIK